MTRGSHMSSLFSCFTYSLVGLKRFFFLCVLLPLVLQFNNPYHLWMLWDPDVRHQRRCMSAHNRLMTDKVKRLRQQPPAEHTIAGEFYLRGTGSDQ